MRGENRVSTAAVIAKKGTLVREHPIASPGEKLSWNRLFGTDSMTEEECGRKPEI